MKGIEIGNLKEGNLTIFDAVNTSPKKEFPTKVIIRKVKNGEIIDSATVTMEDDLDIIIDGPDHDTIEYIAELFTGGIEIDGESYSGERALEGIIKAFQKYWSSYILIVE